MLAVAVLWGTNFPAVKAGLEAGLPASVAASARFSIAAIALLPLLKDFRALPRDLVVGGLECGCWIALGYVAQALALGDLQAGAVAFLASLQVVFVPLVLTATGRSSLHPRLALASFLCLGGVALLELGGLSGQAVAGNVQGQSDLVASLLALLQPVGFGTSYIRIEALMRKYPSHGLQLSALQLVSNAAIALVWAAWYGASHGGVDLSALSEPSVAAGVVYTGLISTALTVLLQTRALGLLPATDSSVIVATEPLWAALFAGLLLGEVLDGSAQLGGLLIVAGCLANSLLPETLGLAAAADDNGDADGRRA
jgi:drug/metabolite transporter (DMT)-like permease